MESQAALLPDPMSRTLRFSLVGTCEPIGSGSSNGWAGGPFLTRVNGPDLYADPREQATAHPSSRTIRHSCRNHSLPAQLSDSLDICAPLSGVLRLPAKMGFVLMDILVLIPILLGPLLYLGWRRN